MSDDKQMRALGFIGLSTGDGVVTWVRPESITAIQEFPNTAKGVHSKLYIQGGNGSINLKEETQKIAELIEGFNASRSGSYEPTE